jgi:CheY-like chemotaxis protein
MKFGNDGGFMAGKPDRHNELMKALGVAVKTARVRLGLSQEGLADRAQLDRSYMSQIERGIKNATLASIHRISKALGLEASELVSRMETVLKEGAQKAAAEQAEKVQQVELQPIKGRILVVDDDEDICSTICAVFQDSGLETIIATSGFDALQMIATNNVTVVISDVRMANGNGLELLAAVRKHYPRLAVFLITGYDDMTTEDALRQGAKELFNKPFDIRRLISTVKTTISNSAVVN